MSVPKTEPEGSGRGRALRPLYSRSILRLFLPLAFLAVASFYPSTSYDSRCRLLLSAGDGGQRRGGADIAPLGPAGHAIVWCEIRPPDLARVMLAVMTGDDLGPPVAVSDGLAVARRPRVACSPDGAIHVVWEEQETGAEAEVFYRASADGGATFTTPPRNLSGNAGRSTDPDIFAGPTGRIHVVWTDDTPGVPSAMYRVSIDEGTSFPSAGNLSGNAQPDRVLHAVVAEDAGGKIVAAWSEERTGGGRVVIARSSDGGTSFAKLTEVIGLPSRHPHHLACLASPLTSNFWHVAWNETDSLESPNESRVWLFSFDESQFGRPDEIPVVSHSPVTAGLSFEGVGGVDLQTNGFEAFLVFEGRKESGRREVFFGHFDYSPDWIGLVELSRVAGESEYGIDRDAAGLAQDFRSPRGGNPAVFEDDTGIWFGKGEPLPNELTMNWGCR
jgi:hypothetical protein